jgi:hypothetical protein
VKRRALVLAVLVLAGCSGAADEEGDFDVPLVCAPEVKRLPCAAGVEAGREYRFNLLTHCGIEWAYLDGRYWVPRPQVDPPSDWAAIEGGTIVLRGREEAVFTADEGGGARFEPAPPGYRPETCA